MSATRMKKLTPAVLILMGALGLGGCATRGYVDEQTAALNQRFDAVDARLAQTDTAVQAARAEGQATAGEVRNLGPRFDQLNARMDSMEQRMAQQMQQPRTPRN